MYALAKILLGQLIFGGIWGISYIVSEYFQHDTENHFYSVVTHNISINPPALHKTSIHKVYS